MQLFTERCSLTDRIFAIILRLEKKRLTIVEKAYSIRGERCTTDCHTLMKSGVFCVDTEGEGESVWR